MELGQEVSCWQGDCGRFYSFREMAAYCDDLGLEVNRSENLPCELLVGMLC